VLEGTWVRIAVLLQGTALTHPAAVSASREERVARVIARIEPNVVVEDDCESIGRHEMTRPQLPPQLKKRIASIVVPEFIGLRAAP
jgi:hypothetical protein